MYKSFKEMKVWQESMVIAELIFRISEILPKKEDYGLTSQIRRSALSISANIAEAFGRKHNKDKINFYYYSRGSIMETQSHLEYGIRVGYFDSKNTVKIEKLLDDVHFEINKIIRTLKNS
ncbi:MAG: four helix bundle protein [Chlorobi bacterium]|nr:four helix bundle protein [Chlorobiota bacterium]